MPDGALTLTFDDRLGERLKRGAEAAGMSDAEFARFVLEQHLVDYADYDWPDEHPSAETPPEELAAEEGVPWPDVARWMRSWGKPDKLPRPDQLTSASAKK